VCREPQDMHGRHNHERRLQYSDWSVHARHGNVCGDAASGLHVLWQFNRRLLCWSSLLCARPMLEHLLLRRREVLIHRVVATPFRAHHRRCQTDCPGVGQGLGTPWCVEGWAAGATRLRPRRRKVARAGHHTCCHALGLRDRWPGKRVFQFKLGKGGCGVPLSDPRRTEGRSSKRSFQL